MGIAFQSESDSVSQFAPSLRPRRITMSLSLTLLTLALASVQAHEYFPGQCPNFTPMSGFEWNKFATGVWFVTRKFSTKSSCLTYEFKTDSEGFKSIEQVRQLPYSERVGLDHEYIYTGKLYAPQESSPAKMIVRFPLNVVGSSTTSSWTRIMTTTAWFALARIWTCSSPTPTGGLAPSSRDPPQRTRTSLRGCRSC